MAAALEPSIPEYLRQERTLPPKLPTSDWKPPFPSYSARFPEEIKDLTMAIIGVQHHERSAREQSEAFAEIRSLVEKPLTKYSPRYWEAASVTDNRGHFNEVAIIYWPSAAEFYHWRSESGFEAWWQSLKPGGDYGWFLETFMPSMDRLETVFSDNIVPEGAAHMRNGISGEVQEHGYWGSMRDRLPLSQTDDLVGEQASRDDVANGRQPSDTRTRRIKVPGRSNLAVIRSGQDWSGTTLHEREKYLETMHPVLIRGMDFLRDEGEQVGCFSCRFMDVVSKSSPGKPTDKTFGLAYFDDLASLESWSKKHKTHLDIFGRFLQYAGELQGNVTLRLFHEVMVLEPQQQVMEYIGCHDGTGMLASLR